MPFPNKETQFKPGQSGNPKGRVKGQKTFKTVLMRALDALDKKKDKNWGNPIAAELIKIAFGKSSKNLEKMRAIEEMLDRLEGKALQKVDAKIEHSASEELLNFLKT